MTPVLAWVLAAILAPDPEPSDLARRREQAAIAFAEGSAAFERGDAAAALVAFERAHDLVPHANVLSNIALCLADLGRHREAITALDAAIARGELTAAEREVAAQHLAQSQRALAMVQVVADDGGTHLVEIDDRESCTTPCALALDPGEHRFVLVEGGPAQSLTLTSGTGARVRLVVPRGVTLPRVEPEVPGPPTRRAHHVGAQRFGALGWIGVGLGAVGGAGVIGFGLRANALHQDYEADPTDQGRTRGLAMRNLANASIAVATGGVLLMAELIRFGVARRRARR
jgi:hypothetical protein